MCSELIFIFASPSKEGCKICPERCLSGRKGRFAKPLYELKLVSRVRIPPSPLIKWMSPDFVGGIFILERCGACSGKSAEIKMGVRGANGHPFDLASPTVDHRVTRSVPVIPPSPQTKTYQCPDKGRALFMIRPRDELVQLSGREATT